MRHVGTRGMGLLAAIIVGCLTLSAGGAHAYFLRLTAGGCLFPTGGGTCGAASFSEDIIEVDSVTSLDLTRHLLRLADNSSVLLAEVKFSYTMDLATGEIKAFSQTFGCDVTAGYCAAVSGSAHMVDTVTFHLPAGMPSATITVAADLQGTIDLFSAVSIHASNYFVALGSVLLGGGNPGRVQSTWLGFDPWFLPLHEEATLTVFDGSPLQFQMMVNAAHAGNGTFDLSHTVRISLQMPPGVTFTSDSGVFLTQQVHDADNDGVLDESDSCPGTLAGEIVNADGCAIIQLCPCENQWKNHGAYVSCIAHTADDFVAAGLITEAEKDARVSMAGASSCGNKKRS